MVNAGDTKIIIGPSRQVAESGQALWEFRLSGGCAAGGPGRICAGVKNIVCLPLESIMQMLCTINYVLNSEKLDLQAVTIHEVKQSSLKEQLERQRSDRAFADEGLQSVHKHNIYTQEQLLLRMVHKATQRPSEHGLPAHRPFAADRWRRISCGR